MNTTTAMDFGSRRTMKTDTSRLRPETSRKPVSQLKAGGSNCEAVGLLRDPVAAGAIALFAFFVVPNDSLATAQQLFGLPQGGSHLLSVARALPKAESPSASGPQRTIAAPESRAPEPAFQEVKNQLRRLAQGYDNAISRNNRGFFLQNATMRLKKFYDEDFETFVGNRKPPDKYKDYRTIIRRFYMAPDNTEARVYADVVEVSKDSTFIRRLFGKRKRSSF